MFCLVICPKVSKTNRSKNKINNTRVEEFVELSKAIETLNVKLVLQLNLSKINAGTFFGHGKINELRVIIKNLEIKLLLIDATISPMQQRNLEKILMVKILDRTGLILEIFGNRAQTKEGVLQVNLAHFEYQKTRLVRSWTHLERQRGGIGFMGGPGETQIESDRRALNEKIFRIRNDLKKVIKTRRLQRSNRQKNNIPIISLVGYTNSGKSSIFNYLTNSNVLEKDMLFATLDPKMSLFSLLGSEKVILLDTVGFISDLPTHLISAFKATLEEVVHSNIILHVRDISHKESEQQAEDVKNTLDRLDWGTKSKPPCIEVYNKIDKLSDSDFNELRSTNGNSKDKVLLSALDGKGFQYLQNQIKRSLSYNKKFEELFIDFSDTKRRGWLFNKKVVSSEAIVDNGFVLRVYWSDDQKRQFRKLS